MARPQRRWNTNIHYHQVILDAIPSGARRALDVGTGNGLLAAELRAQIPEVIGLDVDEQVLGSARAEDPDVTWIHGDVMTTDLPVAGFDLVASVATVHHLDLEAALTRFAELTAPGGVVAVIGLARSSRPRDLGWDIMGRVQKTAHVVRHGEWRHTAPSIWPPPQTYTQARVTIARVLPGATWQRLPMFRYAVIWTKPTG